MDFPPLTRICQRFDSTKIDDVEAEVRRLEAEVQDARRPGDRLEDARPLLELSHHVREPEREGGPFRKRGERPFVLRREGLRNARLEIEDSDNRAVENESSDQRVNSARMPRDSSLIGNASRT